MQILRDPGKDLVEHFPLGIGVAVLRQGLPGLCLGRIHTRRDVIFQPENIEFLRAGSLALASAVAPRSAPASSCKEN